MRSVDRTPIASRGAGPSRYPCAKPRTRIPMSPESPPPRCCGRESEMLPCCPDSPSLGRINRLRRLARPQYWGEAAINPERSLTRPTARRLKPCASGGPAPRPSGVGPVGRGRVRESIARLRATRIVPEPRLQRRCARCPQPRSEGAPERAGSDSRRALTGRGLTSPGSLPASFLLAQARETPPDTPRISPMLGTREYTRSVYLG